MPAGPPPPRRPSAAATRERVPDDVRRARQTGYRVAPGYQAPPGHQAAPGYRSPSGYRPAPGQRSRRRGWAGFVARYGWRAYALPMLVVVTVAALISATDVPQEVSHAVRGGAKGAPPVASSSFTLKADATGGRVNQSVLKAAALPPGQAYTEQGTGTFEVVKGTSPVVGHGRLYRYDVEAEKGIGGINLAQFSALVVATLSDPRSWAGHGVSLQRVDSGQVDFHISLVTPMTVRKLCGYAIHVETSCYAAASGTNPVNRVVFNLARWMRGSAAYVGDLSAYRIYMINHEDGHAMGHEHAHQCLPGGLAPVMMQQTFGLRSAATGKLCEANPWPFPSGAKGVPGAEQPDTPQNDEYGLGD